MKLYGKNAVIERLRANPKSIKKIYLQEGFKGTLNIHKRARQWGIPVLPVPYSKMVKIGRDKNVQGILMDVEDFSYVAFDDLLEAALDKHRCPVFLDGIQDPQNLGAIMRSLACLGKFSLVLPTHDSAGVTETVLRVASGGDNYLPVARVNNLGNAIDRARQQGFHVVGAVVKGGENIIEAELSFPLALVIGSEQKGIRDVNLRHLDMQLSIPMACDTLSFNVAHATAVFCYEITRQKKGRPKK